MANLQAHCDDGAREARHGGGGGELDHQFGGGNQ